LKISDALVILLFKDIGRAAIVVSRVKFRIELYGLVKSAMAWS